MTKPRMPWLPGGRPVPSVARLTGVVLGHGAERSPTGRASPARVGREVGVGAEEVGAESVDEQDHDPPGAAERGGEVERIGRQAVAVDRHAERGRGAGEDVGEGGGAVAAAPPGRAERCHGRAARTCRPVAMSR